MNKPRLEETGRGLTVHAEGRYLYSRYQPGKRPDKAAESAPIENRCIYFVPSPLLGYGLSVLAGRITADSIILAVEQSQELMALCSTHVRENPRIIYVRLSDKESLHALLYSLGPWRFRRVTRLNLNNGASLNPALYDDLTSFLMEDLATYWRNRHALGRLGREWIRHIFANLTEIAYGTTNFRNLSDLKIDSVPIVVGAGPSLESSLNFIKKHRKNLWVVAADTALPALKSAGIKPDAAAVLDTQAWNLLDFHDSFADGMTIFADLSSYPPCITHTGGTCYLFSSNFAELDFLKSLDEFGLREHSIPPLGSVGLAALEISLRLSQGEVLLTGLDFAYTPGKSHARGSSFHRWQISSMSRLNPHPGWEASIKRPRLKSADAFGNPLNTDSILEGYASLLKDRYSGNNRLYVLEPGGLNLGLPVINFQEAERILTSDHLPPEENTEINPLMDSRDYTRKQAVRFLEDKICSLNRIGDAWDKYAAGSGSAEDVVSALEGMDEVYADFHDEPPLPKEDDSFLVRAVSRARRLQRYIERLRAL